ncbi:MAG: 50S ribosomal protein L18 [Candidatus Yanofskybacteria bacterium]|nr:50S ribosomal protein L18 [Candidatus Yanofskybacteria bacterium]
MANVFKKQLNRMRRHRRVRATISGTSDRPRVTVSRSNQHMYAQVIDDTTGKTVAGLSDIKLKEKGSKEMSAKVGTAYMIGEQLANQMKAVGITKAVFDRGGFKYHGRVKAVAEGLRKGGIQL